METSGKIFKKNDDIYKFLFANMQELICLHKPDGTYLFVSPSVENILGYSSDELIGTNPYDLFHPEDVVRIKEKSRDKSLSGDDTSLIYRIRKKNGEYIWVETLTKSIKNEKGDVVNLQTSTRDVSIRVKIYNNLQISRQKYKNLISVLGEGIIFFNDKGEVETFNESAYKILGLTSDEIKNKKIDDDYYRLFDKNLNELNIDQYPAIITSKTGKAFSNVTYGLKKKDGSNVWLSVNTRPLNQKSRDQSNNKLPVVVSFVDITQRIIFEQRAGKYIKELEKSKNLLQQKSNEAMLVNEKLRVSEKKLLEMNANKDKFFSIISHDLRSPFDPLLGFSKIISEEFDDLKDDEIKFYADNIYSASKHLLELLDNLLQWSRLQRGKINRQIETINLNHKINSVIDLLKNNAKNKNIKLYSTLPGQPLKVKVDETMLHSVLQNLTANALKFTPREGEVEIAAEKYENNNALVSVRDTGVGMNKDELNKLFKIEKSFTKPGTEKEKGTGLGLIISKEFITQNSGKIWVESEEGIGTTFYFTLPLS